MWTGAVPWPYMTAGILWSGRMRRAAPLPNWVRASATSLVSDTGAPGTWERERASRSPTRDVAPNDRRANGPRIHRICVPPASITDASTARGGQPDSSGRCDVPRRGNPPSLGDVRRHVEIRPLGGGDGQAT